MAHAATLGALGVENRYVYPYAPHLSAHATALSGPAFLRPCATVCMHPCLCKHFRMATTRGGICNSPGYSTFLLHDTTSSKAMHASHHLR